MQRLKDNDGWTSWVGGVVGEGTENPGMNDGRNEADFEDKGEEETYRPDAVEPEVVEVWQNEYHPVEEILEETIQKDTQV